MNDLTKAMIDELFTNSNGERANQIILIAPDGRQIGGYSELGAYYAIQRAQQRLQADKSGAGTGSENQPSN